MTTQNKIINRELPCKLTEAELAELSKQMASILLETIKLAAELKEIKDDYKTRLDALDTELYRIGNIANNGVEDRQVECTEVYQFAEGVVNVYRNDDSTFVDTRIMNEKEKQMFFVNP